MFDLIDFFVILLNIIFLPLRFSFNFSIIYEDIEIIDIVTIINVFLQIFIKVNTSYYSKGEIIQ